LKQDNWTRGHGGITEEFHRLKRAYWGPPLGEFVAADACFSNGVKPSDKCTSLLDCQFVMAGVRRIEADRSSARAGDGQGTVNVNVAILDSGLGPHSDLNIVGGRTATPEIRGRTKAVTVR